MATGAALAPLKRLARFGPYEFDPAAQELRKHGVKIRLQGQPLQLLAALLETPGEAVHRAELQKKLWPSETFVDFDNGLNSAAKRLRAALADSAENPVYIETLSRTGYRFIAPVHFGGEAPIEPAAARKFPRWPLYLLPLLAVAPLGYLFWRPAAHPEFHQVTFRRGAIFGAAFGPDGQSVVYSAQFGAHPRQIYVNNGVSPESRALGLTGFLLFDVSPKGELALYQYGGTMPTSGGNLLKVPMNGGVPVPVDSNIMSAAWPPNGNEAAVVRVANGQSTLEYPPGKALYSTSGWLSSVSIHPGGERIAFADHPIRHDDSGVVRVIDLDGRTVYQSGNWLSTNGLEWHPDGELWFAATRDASPRSLWAVRPGSEPRAVARFPGVISLRDIAANGAVLLSRDSRRLETTAVSAGGQETDISWLDWTRAVDVTDDGRVLFDESGEGVAARSATFVRKIGDAEAARIADGQVALGFSPGGDRALTLSQDDRKRLHLYSLAGGAPVAIRPTGLEYQWARFFPGGRHLLALAGQPLRLYRVDIETAAREPISPPGMVRYAAISPDGGRVAYLTAAGKLLEWSAAGTRELHAGEPLAPVQYAASGRFLFVQHVKSTALPARVSEFDLARGTWKPWRQVAPADPVGVDLITRVLLSPGGNVMTYSARRIQSELFRATNLR